jgi:hypothetical protein
MDKKILTIMLSLFFLLCPVHSLGWFPFNPLPSYEQTDERQQLADRLLAEIDKIYDSIPDLSPKEAKWLEAEIASENPHRSLKAYASDEYTKREVKKSVRIIRSCLLTICKYEYIDLKQEMLIWVIVADNFMFSGTALDLSALVGNKVINVDSKNKYDNQDLVRFYGDMIAKTILEEIVAPYLAEYKKKTYLKTVPPERQ